eukprot:TRINITY_DN11135_c0_g1_i3.p3 TRINITY_DN11135_c0_g1~~TRINITY_DN11135_c0_g1_i3.p3  ORF type:complete len:178 (+),score=27.60 TRINITY_DN11135_c0_g1_i3:435-968(+)
MVWPKRVALRHSSQLEETSKWHSCYQSLEDDFDHVEADNSTPMVRAARFGFHGKAVGEVLTQGYQNPYQVVASWICSDTHRDVMFKCKVSQMGVAVSQSEYNIPYATATFGCQLNRFCTCNGLLANGTNVVEQWPDFGCEGIKVQRAHQPTSQCQGKKKNITLKALYFTAQRFEHRV